MFLSANIWLVDNLLDVTNLKILFLDDNIENFSLYIACIKLSHETKVRVKNMRAEAFFIFSSGAYTIMNWILWLILNNVQ